METFIQLFSLDVESLGWIAGTKKSLPLKLWNQTISRTCEILGKKVWPAILGLLPADTKRLILMPGAGFNILPLHAAPLEGGLRVCDRFTISYIPSFVLLKSALKKGLPVEDAILGQAVNPTGDLPFSTVEARMVAQSYSSNAVSSLPGSEATVKKVLQMLLKADIFHFAGHGYFDPHDPMRSRLFCKPEKIDTGSLTLSTILNRAPGIKSRFFILSACETGLTEAGESGCDFLGFPGGLLVTGAAAILSTLWRVDDLATALLLSHFAEQWKGGKQNIAEALQASQNWLRSRVTVDTVVDILADWLDILPELEDKLVMQHGRWAARNDRDALPFKDEIYWGAFYLTGV